MDFQSLKDQELLELIAHGSHAAFREIFVRYHTVLLIHAYNKLQDRDEAQDVVQEVFSRIWTRRHQLKADQNIHGFLFTIVKHQIFDLLRHKQHIKSFEDSFNRFTTQQAVVSDHLARERQFAAIIEKEIAALPPRMREVFELRRKEHLPNKAIAARMQITEATVADQMKKALRQLRLKLGLFVWILMLFWR